MDISGNKKKHEVIMRIHLNIIIAKCLVTALPLVDRDTWIV